MEDNSWRCDPLQQKRRDFLINKSLSKMFNGLYNSGAVLFRFINNVAIVFKFIFSLYIVMSERLDLETWNSSTTKTRA